MRALILPAAALALAGAVVLVGGRMVSDPVVDQSDLEDVAVAGAVTTGEPAPLAAPAQASMEQAVDSATTPPPQAGIAERLWQEEALASQPAPAAPQSPSARSRLVAPAVVAPPELAGQQLEREAPREPLSQLSLALPPKPQIKNEWAGKPFFRPVAVESAVFESAGQTISIAGVRSLPSDESCVHEGEPWPCGVRARTAFRLWLRGRALVCQSPEEEENVTRARCRLAKQDVGTWLVENGWALAAPDGPYVQAEERARAAGIGIFGAPPDTSSVSAVPDAPPVNAQSQSILADDDFVPQPPNDPRLAFPPAPSIP